MRQVRNSDLSIVNRKLDQNQQEMRALEMENHLLRQILFASSEPTLITTPDAKITYVNPAWEDLTGYSFTEVEGKNARILSSGKTPARLYKKMWQTLKSGQTFVSEEVVNKKKNGHEYTIRSSIYPVMLHGKVVYFVQIQHDITTVKRLDELRKEFLSASAHELKTPITVLKLLTDSHIKKARMSGSDTIKAQELDLINRELDRLILLINDLLDSSRFETGKQFMEFEESDLVELLMNATEKMRVYAKHHILILNKLPKHLSIIADRTRIEQVLMNIFTSLVVGTAAAIFQKLLRDVTDIKSENELTV